MHGCNACMRRCTGTVFADVLNPHRPPWRLPLTRQSAQTISRPRQGYATEAIRFENLQVPNSRLDVGVRKQYLANSPPPPQQVEPFSRTSLEQELRWLSDPLKLGDHVVKLLRKDDDEKALALVRLASKDIACTVSWNYLIDFSMGKGRVSDAVKLYNEMKKRAQQPDAYTFTTLFRGFALHTGFSLSVSRTLSIYHSMFAENSPVRPSIIHTNAVLKVCALAGDIDALLGVAARLPRRGNGAPNNRTFTTVLNAIRSDAFAVEYGDERTPMQVEKQIKAVVQGRRLWVEIRDLWERGELLVDEELVCAMGRLLLIRYDGKDCDDILSLLEQTMGLSRQVPRIGEPGWRASRRYQHAIHVPEDELFSLDEMVPVPHEDISESEHPSDSQSDAFAPLPHGPPSSQAAVRPGRNTLSMVLDACINTHMIRAAQNYWGLLTDPAGSYQISPDTENCYMYLRLLRKQRASRLAVEFVNDMRQGTFGPEVGLDNKTFRTALACCVRDKANRNSISNAAKLVHMMNKTLSYPDARALETYLTVARLQEPLEWRILMDVVKDVSSGISNLRSLLAYNPEVGKEQEVYLKDLVKAEIGAIDIVLDLGNEDMRRKEKKMFGELKNTLQAWLTRMANMSKSPEERRRSRYPLDHENGRASSGDDENERAHEAVNAVRAVKEKNWKMMPDKRVASSSKRLAQD